MWLPDGGRRLWRLVLHPEFEKTWAKAEEKLSRPEAHMAAIQRAVARNPFAVSFPTVSETQRVVRTIEPLDGWETRVYFRVNEEDHTCELGWVQIKPLESEDSS